MENTETTENEMEVKEMTTNDKLVKVQLLFTEIQKFFPYSSLSIHYVKDMMRLSSDWEMKISERDDGERYFVAELKNKDGMTNDIVLFGK